MDVVKVLGILIACFLLATSCSPATKSVESVTTTAKECGGSSLQSRFIVQWEDGSFSVEHATDMEEFKKTFVTDNLSLIRHVDADHHIQLHQDVLPQSEVQPNSGTAVMNWGPQIIQADQLWKQNLTGEGVIIAVVDGMVDITHPQLRPNILINENEIADNGIDDDNNGFIDDVYGVQINKEINDPLKNRHGSHVSGIIAADPDQGPVHGIAHRAKILPAQFIANDSGGSLGDAIIAMNYAASRGAKIMNLSWGGAPCVPNLKAAMKALSDKGILLITAAGNGDKYGRGIDIDSNPDYPSGFNLLNQINIAASTIDDFMISFSNFGLRTVHIAAPGVDIYSTTPGNKIELMSGTSMSAPMTSGAAALLWGAYPKATSQQIKLALLKGVDVTAGHVFEVSTHGRINVNKSLSELKKILGL